MLHIDLKYIMMVSHRFDRFKRKEAKELPAALRKEKQKAGLSEDMVKFNELYKENLERALANNNVDNVRDIPLKIKSAL